MPCHAMPKLTRTNTPNGLMNLRCKTKMGSRLLERWLRQPLTDKVCVCAHPDLGWR